MMMKDEFVHFHAIPRYSKELTMHGKTWIDEDYPKGTKLNKVECDFDTLMKIKKDMM